MRPLQVIKTFPSLWIDVLDDMPKVLILIRDQLTVHDFIGKDIKT